MGGEGLARGARNLIGHAAGLRAGQRLLLVCEDPATGYYDPGLGGAVARAAAELGIAVDRREVPFRPEVAAPPPDLAAAMRAADRTVFLARLGDQLRFSPSLARTRPVVCYALDREMLASGFGQAHHHAFVALKRRIDAALAGAARIRVTCPLGTDFEGPGARFPQAGGEVTVARFPLSVFSPVPAGPFRGRIAQAGFLTGTGSRYYAPYTQPLGGVLGVRVEGTRIAGFDGSPRDVARAEAHYAGVAARFGIDGAHVHSWHAGIHPGCAFTGEAGASPERWSGAAFGNPRILHVHTCGAYAPGEISLNVIDPTIRLDGVAVWENGRLHPERVPGGAAVLARYPCAAAVFARPAQAIGLAPSGRLEARVAEPAA